jgi:hypothetical protein
MGPSGNRRARAWYSKSWYAERSLPARPAALRPIGYRIGLTGGFSGPRATHACNSIIAVNTAASVWLHARPFATDP